jgi:hypothetical protein
LKLPSQSGQQMTFFVYSCPENISIKVKMTMSTSKATVIATAVENGVSIDRLVVVQTCITRMCCTHRNCCALAAQDN